MDALALLEVAWCRGKLAGASFFLWLSSLPFLPTAAPTFGEEVIY